MSLLETTVSTMRTTRFGSTNEEAVGVFSIIATAAVAVIVSVVATTATAGVFLPRVLLRELILFVPSVTTLWRLTHA